MHNTASRSTELNHYRQDTTMTNRDSYYWEISSTDDIIDSRQIIDRIAELTSDENISEDEVAELAGLMKLSAEGIDYADDWEFGVTLIRDSYFRTYAMELADDIGAIPNDLAWPMTCIDWEQAARELQMDYTPVDFNGASYWLR